MPSYCETRKRRGPGTDLRLKRPCRAGACGADRLIGLLEDGRPKPPFAVAQAAKLCAWARGAMTPSWTAPGPGREMGPRSTPSLAATPGGGPKAQDQAHGLPSLTAVGGPVGAGLLLTGQDLTRFGNGQVAAVRRRRSGPHLLSGDDVPWFAFVQVSAGAGSRRRDRRACTAVGGPGGAWLAPGPREGLPGPHRGVQAPSWASWVQSFPAGSRPGRRDSGGSGWRAGLGGASETCLGGRGWLGPGGRTGEGLAGSLAGSLARAWRGPGEGLEASLTASGAMAGPWVQGGTGRPSWGAHRASGPGRGLSGGAKGR